MPTSAIEVQIRVRTIPAAAYALVAEVRRMARWSPECVGIWVLRRRPDGGPASFLGWNRRGFFLWFTSCRVVAASPGEEFAFDVSSFGLPVARWGYRFAAQPDGTTEITEYWLDHRRGRTIGVLSRVFTGVAGEARTELNRAGMRTTLERLRAELEHDPKDEGNA